MSSSKSIQKKFTLTVETNNKYDKVIQYLIDKEELPENFGKGKNDRTMNMELEAILKHFIGKIDAEELGKKVRQKNISKVNEGKKGKTQDRFSRMKEELSVLIEIQKEQPERTKFYINSSIIRNHLPTAKSQRDYKALIENTETNAMIEEANKSISETENYKFKNYPNKTETGQLDFILKGLSEKL